MIRIESTRANITRDKKVVDMQVSTVAELPELNENVDGIVIAAGSIAQIIQTGDFVTLDYDGKWYDESGDAVNGSEVG